MTEHKLFAGPTANVSTAEFHADRERAPHLEQDVHRPRLHMARDLIRRAAFYLGGPVEVSDLGCGDGGLLALLKNDDRLISWGYDFCPANAAGWAEREVIAEYADVFGDDWATVRLGDVVVMTEVLEHLTDPHGVLRQLASYHKVKHVVASSPWNETPESHSAEHAWAWDRNGYENMFWDAGWRRLEVELVGSFQVVLASRA